LKYLSSGEGKKTLVFLHGALVRPDIWFYPITKLEDKIRVIAPLFPPQLMGAQEAADYIRAILKKENIAKAILIGYSYGGGVAQYFAEKHPDMLDKLILSHTGLLGRESSISLLEKFKKVVNLLPFFLIKMKIKDRIECVPSSEWNEFHKSYFLEINSKMTKRLFLDYIDSMLKFANEAKDFPEDKREWKGETILLGTRSDKDAFEHFDRLLELYPNSKSYFFKEEGGHHMLFLFPEEYTQVLIQCTQEHHCDKRCPSGQ
jgi:pimeloyl-ACP methyl ester carboxylesterase